MATAVNTTKAPNPIGPFSQAVVTGNLVYVSAQFAFDTSTGEFLNGHNRGGDEAGNE